MQKNPNYFSYLRFGAEEYTEDSTFDTDVAIAQSLFALVTIRDLLMQNMTDEALEFINGEYLPEERVDEIIDDDLRAEVQAFIDSKSPNVLRVNHLIILKAVFTKDQYVSTKYVYLWSH